MQKIIADKREDTERKKACFLPLVGDKLRKRLQNGIKSVTMEKVSRWPERPLKDNVPTIGHKSPVSARQAKDG